MEYIIIMNDNRLRNMYAVQSIDGIMQDTRLRRLQDKVLCNALTAINISSCLI